jgi:hypothetical protein
MPAQRHKPSESSSKSGLKRSHLLLQSASGSSTGPYQQGRSNNLARKQGGSCSSKCRSSNNSSKCLLPLSQANSNHRVMLSPRSLWTVRQWQQRHAAQLAAVLV